MKFNSVLYLLLLYIACFVLPRMYAAVVPLPQSSHTATYLRQPIDTLRSDSLIRGIGTKVDSAFLLKKDSIITKADSLQRAIEVHRTDTVRTDSLQADSIRAKDNGLTAVVNYSAADSMTYDAATGLAYLYGKGNVQYENMTLDAGTITLNMDSSVVHAAGLPDTTDTTGLIHTLQETPVYKQGTDTYESELMSYNFKSRKGFINNVRTQQGDGFMQSEKSKRDSTGILYLEHAKYTTCDEKCPHFYISLSRAKVRPGKDVIFGPAYLVVADVPLPLAIPYGFFPFNKKYSSGFVMPSYGDERIRGFYLRDGGYYFAMSDRMDLKLLGEVYTKGSWGLSLETNYIKRYRYSGNFYASYITTVEGEKNLPDYSKSTSLKLQWRHTQDAKASPNSSFSASVNFASQNYERNNLMSIYNPISYTQSTRASSISYSRSFPSLGLSISSSANISQNMKDSSIFVSLPDLSISLARIFPFKRKKQAGKERWYEKISLSYTGQLTNSISTKENKLFKSNVFKDWENAMTHSIPVSATFNLFNYINVTPSFNFFDRFYSRKTMRSWDQVQQSERADTLRGFYNVYNWNLALSLNTTLYGFYVPSRKFFGDGIIAIRHLAKPSISLTYAPNFGDESYGYYTSYVKTDAQGNVSTVNYSPYMGQPYFGVPTVKTGTINMSLSNNLEMKVKSSKDSTGERKISLVDELYGALSYNMAAHRWSNLSTRIRLKLTKSYTFSLAAVFATYAYKFAENGSVIEGDRTEWSYGRFGRFQGMSQNFSYTFNNNTWAKWFGKKKQQNQASSEEEHITDTSSDDLNESNMDPDIKNSHNAAKQKGKAQVDEDGYLKFSIPWSFTVSYGVTMHEDRSKPINDRRMRYPYSFTQTLNFSGNIRLANQWNINYSSGYDIEARQLTMTTASLTRDLHCFSISASMVLKPYTSYNLTLRANASALADVLKYEKRSSYSSNIEWY